MNVIKQFLRNAMNSWVTTGVGAAYGLPKIWQQVDLLFDGIADTNPDWGIVLKGLGALVFGMFLRDWTPAIIKDPAVKK